MAAIVADLDTRRHDFHVAIENWQHDFNIGTIVRFGQRLPRPRGAHRRRTRWNRRGAMVTDRYQHVRHHGTPPSLAAYLPRAGRGRCRASTTCPGRCTSRRASLPRRVCFLFGQEGPGLSGRRREACDATFSIAQFGSTRSINASAAAAIAMHSLGPRARRPVRRRRLAGLTSARDQPVGARARQQATGRCPCASTSDGSVPVRVNKRRVSGRRPARRRAAAGGPARRPPPGRAGPRGGRRGPATRAVRARRPGCSRHRVSPSGSTPVRSVTRPGARTSASRTSRSSSWSASSTRQNPAVSPVGE